MLTSDGPSRTRTLGGRRREDREDHQQSSGRAGIPRQVPRSRKLNRENGQKGRAYRLPKPKRRSEERGIRSRQSPTDRFGSSQCFAIALHFAHGNDPSAGSPTETLLRLLLPLNDQVRATSRRTGPGVSPRAGTNPGISLNHSIGSSDGRCVQRAGT